MNGMENYNEILIENLRYAIKPRLCNRVTL